MNSGARVDRAVVEEFLIQEAQLLDDRKFEEWLALFTDDALYTIPAGSDGRGDGVFVVSEDRRGLEERVWRLRHPAMHAQIPPSETVHLVSNVQLAVSNSDADSSASTGTSQRVLSNFIVYEVRVGEQRSFAGRYEHVLRHGKDGWRIAFKKVSLVNRTLPLRNVTFLL
jgi:3-phenylpropionate/cinnamic acid dioxygenase small subunit